MEQVINRERCHDSSFYIPISRLYPNCNIKMKELQIVPGGGITIFYIDAKTISIVRICLHVLSLRGSCARTLRIQ